MFGLIIAALLGLLRILLGGGILAAASVALNFLFYWYAVWTALLALPVLLIYLGVVSASTIMGLFGGNLFAFGPLGGIFGFLFGNVASTAMLGSLILKRGLLLTGTWLASTALAAGPLSLERLAVGLLLWVVGLVIPSF